MYVELMPIGPWDNLVYAIISIKDSIAISSNLPFEECLINVRILCDLNTLSRFSYTFSLPYVILYRAYPNICLWVQTVYMLLHALFTQITVYTSNIFSSIMPHFYVNFSAIFKTLMSWSTCPFKLGKNITTHRGEQIFISSQVYVASYMDFLVGVYMYICHWHQRDLAGTYHSCRADIAHIFPNVRD